ncbi:FGGY family carbohydrate kinase [Chelativorans sp. AA-79]|uniref:FGGY-family carbohydrate kinase n=1 Tax=Chelativorans sp. AA-79 TaxID=3028735 RepID=UPI0023F7B63D|nr:FGGY family carbohydrate kinase [Chelativorans sp. AA-79]WEX08687.1 FGGY family carbohydrate kinase [Chelativorans sp. AA-79]
MAEAWQSGLVAVLDVGKTNVKLSAATTDGAVLETLSVENPVCEGPPWRHHDLNALRGWVLDGLATLSRRYPLEAFVASGHGSGGVLVVADPDDGDGTALPMIDYEQPLPESIREAYAPLSGTFFDRGSATMHGATHQARQLYWMQQAEPAAFSRGRWFLGVPQYWAWVLSGIAVSEMTLLAAQSHLWNAAERRWAPIVARQGWRHLLPPFAKAWQMTGTLRPALAARHGLPDRLRILAGGHDSSLNYYRYQAAGLKDITVVSTGTWIVCFSGRTPLDRLDENRGMTCNSDVFGHPLGGVLTMGGREFAAIAGSSAPTEKTRREVVARLIARGTMALPSFGEDDGLFPGSAGRGRLAGTPPETPEERKALAIVYCALLTVECLDALGDGPEVMLDGSFLRDPLYAALVAGFAPGRRICYNLDAYGVASGAALLAGHETRTQPAPVELSDPAHLGDIASMLAPYAARWRAAARATSSKSNVTKGPVNG